MLTYYSVIFVAPDGSTGEGYCLADSPEQATAKILAEIKAAKMDATIQSITPVCEADLRSLSEAGLLLTLSVEEFSQVLAAEILVTNQAVEMIAKKVVAKSRGYQGYQVDRSKELAGPMDDHSDEYCYPIYRGRVAPPSLNAVLNSVFSALWAY